MRQLPRRVIAAALAVIPTIAEAAVMGRVSNIGKTTTTSTPSSSRSSAAFDYMRRKHGPLDCPDQQVAVWVYTGSLHDPLTGNEIATVEGLELVQNLGEGGDGSCGAEEAQQGRCSLARWKRRCRKFQVAEAAAETTDFRGTVLSRKLFCYTEPATGLLLETVRTRRGGPVTRLPLNQAVTAYDTAVSCLESADKTWLLHTEWPRGAVVWGRATSRKRSGFKDARSTSATIGTDSDAVEFSVFTRAQTKPLRAEDLRPTAEASDSTASPARSALVQFGASKQESNHRYGARETFHFTGDDTVRYTRYGESPVWYGPSRMCQVELTGKRFLLLNDARDAMQHLVPVAAAVIRHHFPNFWRFGAEIRPAWMPDDESCGRGNVDDQRDDRAFSYYAEAVHSALQTDADGSASEVKMSGADYHRYYADLAVRRTVDRFRKQRPLGIVTDQSTSRGRLRRLGETAQLCWDKVRAASTISVGGIAER